MSIQRGFDRWQIGKEAAILFKDADEYINCRLEDFDLQGFAISLPLKLPVNTFVEFELKLSEELSVNAQALVVWHKPQGQRYSYGFYLSRMTQQDRKNFEQFIRLYTTFREKSYGEEKKVVVLEKGEAQVNDRRIFQRFEASFPVSFLDVADGSEGEGRIQDVSAKGIGVVAARELKPRSSLELWLRIPDRGAPLYTRGEVVWVSRIDDGQYLNGINLERADLMGLSRILRIQE